MASDSEDETVKDWQGLLRQAWAAFYSSTQATPEMFAAKALKLGARYPECRADVFERAPGSIYHTMEKPRDAYISLFYREVIAAYKEPLDVMY